MGCPQAVSTERTDGKNEVGRRESGEPAFHMPCGHLVYRMSFKPYGLRGGNPCGIGKDIETCKS